MLGTGMIIKICLFLQNPPYYGSIERRMKNRDAPINRTKNPTGGRPRDFTAINEVKTWHAESDVERYTLFDPA